MPLRIVGAFVREQLVGCASAQQRPTLWFAGIRYPECVAQAATVQQAVVEPDRVLRRPDTVPALKTDWETVGIQVAHQFCGSHPLCQREADATYLHEGRSRARSFDIPAKCEAASWCSWTSPDQPQKKGSEREPAHDAHSDAHGDPPYRVVESVLGRVGFRGSNGFTPLRLSAVCDQERHSCSPCRQARPGHIAGSIRVPATQSRQVYFRVPIVPALFGYGGTAGEEPHQQLNALGAPEGG
jgi:hypothetical protein